MKKPLLIFDYDGTLHNTILIYEKAFRQCYAWLVEEGHTKQAVIPRERIAGWLGMNSRDMWNSFLPQLPESVKKEAGNRIGTAMVEQICHHQAQWYPGAEKVLNQLKEEGYSMVILSNCKIAYHQVNWQEFGMERWFMDFFDCESFDFRPKTEIIQEIKKALSPPFIVIGDRYSDLACARACQSPFIGCQYGFGEPGELEEADVLVDSVEKLPAAIASCC